MEEGKLGSTEELETRQLDLGKKSYKMIKIFIIIFLFSKLVKRIK